MPDSPKRPAISSEPEAPGSKSRRTLWLFGDSFVGAPDARDRVDATFVHNTIALSRCTERGFEIEYFWGESAQGLPTAFFDSGSDSPYWWLFDGFTHEGVLYVGLLEIAEAPAHGPLQLPFRMTGMRLARIANPHERPSDWRIETSRLSSSEAAFPGASMLLRAEHVYFFAFEALSGDGQPRFLTRLAIRDLEAFPADLEPHLETLAPDGRWLPGLLPDQALVLMDDSATEMSVEFDPRLGRWTAIYGSPIQGGAPSSAAHQAAGDPAQGPDGAGSAESSPALSDRVFIRTAERPEGPWSARRLLLRIPEPSERRDPNLVCYAAKGHLEFAPPDGLLVTYVCNLHALEGEEPWPILERLVRDMEIYRPRPVRVPFPADPGDARSRHPTTR